MTYETVKEQTHCVMKRVSLSLETVVQHIWALAEPACQRLTDSQDD